ncbi:alpha/beta-hydrolase [Polychaeton citri CBS 116435]|uniref:Carboxypeptidase n=1 Tax=Polychaeton citri CBS 116435 TaxID=1314669 RepID=A0A9P4UK82_9PEZI|nr:alpha/beta-hydrolase [Polychaeton citri CBS 116435]
MRGCTALFTCALATLSLARSPNHAPAGRKLQARHDAPAPKIQARDIPPYGGNATLIPQNANTTKFVVNGTAIPDVDFDIGESYAGLLPISDKANSSELYFWFFPSGNPLAEDEILIWLNGGPGCSSLEGLLQENGPFLWQYGTFKPVQNQWTWVNLTNVVWVEQPAGTGFSQKRGTPSATDELEVAAQFLGFWKNFVDTFGLHNKKVYIAGESYAGYYVPYIADAMHNETDECYYNIESILFYDPSLSYEEVQNDIPSIPMLDYFHNIFNLNETFTKSLHDRWTSCGYEAFYNQAMTFPPNGTLPTPPSSSQTNNSCELWNDIANAALLVNPCWDIYQIATTCPVLWDVLGFPGSFEYLPDGATIYFNRTDVQKAINAPVGPWSECSNGVLDTDNSPPSGLSILPRVIEKNKKTIIGHGNLDFILLLEGTIMMTQNMTWGGKQGFSKGPEHWHDFYVPYHSEYNLGTLAGAGVFGKWWEERKFTLCTVDLSGHMIPQYQPSAAYRQVEYLLGRISSLGEVSDFTVSDLQFLPQSWCN